MVRDTYNVRGATRASPEVASLLLSPAAAVGLSCNVAAEASWQNSAAVGTILQAAVLKSCRSRKSEGDEEGHERDGGEMHI